MAMATFSNVFDSWSAFQGETAEESLDFTDRDGYKCEQTTFC